MTNLQKAAVEYLQVRRALGFKLVGAHSLLIQFTDFMAERNLPVITTPVALEWATRIQACHPGRWAIRLSVVRGFARFLQARDPRTEVPPVRLLSHRYRRKNPRLPSDEDVRKLLKATGTIRSPKGLWRMTYRVLFGLLAATGMRVGEVVALDCQDVDLRAGVITIRNAKYGKSRVVPIHFTTVKALASYRRLRNRILPSPSSKSFFVSERGARLRAKAVGKKYLVVARQAQIRVAKGREGPRLHDLRHRFAVRTLLAWYQTDVDVERRLPVLATYLGHLDMANTYWYLSAHPELLRLAALRVDSSHGGQTV